MSSYVIVRLVELRVGLRDSKTFRVTQTQLCFTFSRDEYNDIVYPGLMFEER